MNRVAFMFTSAPHGISSGREGLDALLASSALTNDIGVFFIGDGVFQLLSGQKPHRVLARDYISTFKVLPLYDIKTFLVCASSLQVRGLSKKIPMVLKTKIVDSDIIYHELVTYDVVLNF